MYSDQLLFNQMENCNMCQCQNTSDGIPNGLRGIAQTFLVCSFLFLPFTTAAQNIIYVDSSAADGGNGTTWDSAYQDLQEALHAARDTSVEIDQIWVAKGTYYPSETGDPAVSFELVDAVPLYGGFAGGENVLRERNWEGNRTILDGTSSNHIVRADSTSTAIDGFVIKNGDGYGISGAGLFISESNITLNNLILANNYAESGFKHTGGGGLYLQGSSAKISNVEFHNNRAGVSGGGALIIDSDVVMSGVDFRSNSTFYAGFGGGLHISNSSVSIIHSNFIGNRISVSGAAANGGAIYSEQSELHIASSLFANNRVDQCGIPGPYGSALYITGPDAAQTTLANIAFLNNTAEGCHDRMEGGAIHVTSDSVRIVNATIYGNAVKSSGTPGADPAHIVNGAVSLHNSIVWGNTGANLSDNVFVTHSTIENGNTGHNVVSIEPEFVEDPSPGPDSTWGTDDDEYGRLQEGSSLNDFGDRHYLPSDSYDLDEDGNTAEKVPVDFAGNTRVQNGAIDLGPFEFATSTDTGSRQITHPVKLRVYPNPVATNATIEVVAPRPQTFTINLFDLLGRKVKTWRRSRLHTGINEIRLTTKHISSGIYFLRVSNSHNVVSTSIAVR